MSFLDRFLKKTQTVYVRGQTREGWNSGIFAGFNAGLPFQHDIKLYNTMRATFPFLDGIPGKFNKLIGDFEFETYGNESLKKYLEDFKAKVRVNQFGVGWNNFRAQVVDNTLSAGFDVSETVIEPAGNGINRLQTTKPESFDFLKTEDGQLVLAQKNDMGQLVPIEDMSTVYYTTIDQRRGHPRGYSIYYPLPFMTQILNRMYKSVDNTMWRIGDPSFLVAIEGGTNATNKAVKDAATSIVGEMNVLMEKRRQGQPYDIVAGVPEGSKIRIDIVGGDGKFIDGLEFTLKNIIEQCISSMGLPMWMYGFHWTSRETLAKYESDMAISRAKEIRMALDVLIEKVFGTQLVLGGYSNAKWTHIWGDVNLLDEKEQALARKENSVAMKNEILVLQSLLELGISPEEAQEYMQLYGIKTTGAWWSKAVKDARAVGMVNKMKMFENK